MVNNKNYILTEHQLSLILSEIRSDRLTSSVKSLNTFSKKIISSVARKYKINLRVLLTWGSAVGGFMMPRNEYIKTGNFDMNDEQISLVLVGVVATYFLNNKTTLNLLISKIKEEGLYDFFSNVLSKSNELKDAFFSFIKSLNSTFESTVEIVSYAFLIPIVDDVLSYVTQSKPFIESAENIAERLIASGVVVLAGQALLDIINKIIKRFYKEY